MSTTSLLFAKKLNLFLRVSLTYITAVNKHTTDENATLLYTAAKNRHINEVKMLLTTTNALVDKV